MHKLGAWMFEPAIAILALAFGLGLLHALDADHIAAVSALACERRSKRSAVYYSLLWSSGHSLTVLFFGSSVYLLDLAVPDSISLWAERLVGLVLIIIGALVLWEIRSRRLQLQVHKHEDMPIHAHWQDSTQDMSEGQKTSRHKHTPLLVGSIHGVAGSAPLLALLPFTAQQEPWQGMAYLLLFCLGVFTAMLSFGGVMEWLMRRFMQTASRVLRFTQLLIGSASILLGAWVMHGVF